MITKKQWSDFQKYRAGLYLEWLLSDRYQEISKRRVELHSPVERKFLWFKWKEYPSLHEFSRYGLRF